LGFLEKILVGKNMSRGVEPGKKRVGKGKIGEEGLGFSRKGWGLEKRFRVKYGRRGWGGGIERRLGSRENDGDKKCQGA